MIEMLATHWVAITVGVLLAFLPYVRKASSYYSTLIHEIGHGVSALNPTGGLGGISLRPDTSGENQVSYRSGGLFYLPIRVASLMAGYAAPIYVGALFYLVAIFELDEIFKYVMLIVCALTLLAIRNLFGALVILLHACFWVITLIFGLVPLTPALITLGTILLARGLLDVVGVTKYSFVPKYKGMGTDFDLLQDEFFLPRQVWCVLFYITHITLISLIVILLSSLTA